MVRKENYEWTNLSLDEDNVAKMYFLKGFLNFFPSKTGIENMGKI
jgi:hypothetical protein